MALPLAFLLPSASARAFSIGWEMERAWRAGWHSKERCTLVHHVHHIHKLLTTNPQERAHTCWFTGKNPQGMCVVHPRDLHTTITEKHRREVVFNKSRQHLYWLDQLFRIISFIKLDNRPKDVAFPSSPHEIILLENKYGGKHASLAEHWVKEMLGLRLKYSTYKDKLSWVLWHKRFFSAALWYECKAWVWQSHPLPFLNE